MQKFIVTGGVPLRGEVRIAGAKNAVLKMMAAAALTDDASILRNVPRISDVQILRGVMSDIGFSIKPLENDALEIKASGADWLFVPLEAAMKMRSSFILLGPLLTRFGRVIISNPGGDRIGRRPVDLHVDAMRTLGAEIEYKNGYYFAQAPGGLKGARVTFPYVTVMGTENAMLAATLAKGTTVIENAAQEPEVDDLATMLRGMGAQIERTAPHRLARWARARKSENAMAAHTFDGINRLFSNDGLGATVLRGPLLGIAGRLPPLANALWRRAAGSR